ncbi:LysR family transcriptional regulator [Neptunicella marina]|uniref:LysR family transcriptional regulator n=1 Tax=Neptunicella marina TaxID=2125989 RepID=A0A8J6IPU2_9ALTE|nr:LysR family transcriptional regulator [Neptunicella marina]MBC3764384.1 LysR family transcriptional regulator [Neptunicella marina]
MFPKITLEQWATFKAVVEEGSFAKAAERLNKSQSSVSYIVSCMQQQLPVPALVQQGRKSELTEAGKLLYRHASNLLSQAKEIENIAKYLATGWETEITLALDAVVPQDPLFCALQRFSSAHPEPRINIVESVLSGTDEAVLFRKADIVLSPTVVTGFIGIPLSKTDLVYVASPSHPLGQLDRKITALDLQRHRQIVVKDSGLKRQRDAGWLGAEQRWSFSHLNSSIEAAKAGLGFAKLPRDRIRQPLHKQELVQLDTDVNMDTHIPIYLIKTAQSEAGPAVEALTQFLLESFKQEFHFTTTE